MPPRKRAAAKAAGKAVASPPPSPPLHSCKVALCGTFPGNPQATLKQSIERLGATALNGVSPDATHLVSSPENFRRSTAKNKAAQAQGIPVVGVQWLLACLASNLREDEAPYLLGQHAVTAPVVPAVVPHSSSSPPSAPSLPSRPSRPAPSSAVTAPANGIGGTKKRSAASNAAANDSVSPTTPQPDAKRQKMAGNHTNGTTDTKGANDDKTEAGPAKIVVPVDELCPIANACVYVDEHGVVFDASLNQTNSGANNNKFYRVQLLRKTDGEYQTWTRWGRVGERGQSAALGSGDLDGALKDFNKKFRDKSGLAWEKRDMDPKPGKYAFVERSYQPDSGNESDTSAARGGSGDDTDGGRDEHGPPPPPEPPECTLSKPVQDLVELIFNRQFFAATMSDLNYDANKLPLGKLSKVTIRRGFQALKDLSALIDDASLAQTLHGLDYASAVERLSNLYYSVIPHAFGRNRPPILQDYARLKKEIELLESLGDMKDAELLMKMDRATSDTTHPADKHYQGLGMEEVTPLNRDSTEFVELASYLDATRGATHSVKYEIDGIFRIERKGEQDRFDMCALAGVGTDTRLLWHGSRVTNFGGILSQGLRIAPPEAPASGYMFGKGIYLADMSSKSANYCRSDVSGGTALLLLCEAKLGSPLQELTGASYSAGDDAKSKGMFCTLGKGRTAPKAWKDAGIVHNDLAGVKMPDVSCHPGKTNVEDATLLYNEYIVYDVSQVRLRYLFRVRI